MPKGDPAGYLPSVKKSRQMAKAKGGKPYTPRMKREASFAPSKGVRRSGPVPTKGVARPATGGPKPPFSMTDRPKFAKGSAPRKLATTARYNPDSGRAKKKGFPDNFSPQFRRVMEGPTRKRIS